MKLKNTKYIVISFLAIIALFTISYFFFLRSFIQNTTFYEPFSVEIKGISSDQFQLVSCYGVSPQGRTIELNKNIKNCSFKTGCYIHLNDIVFYCNDSIFSQVTAINVDLNDESSPYIIDFGNSKIRDELLTKSNNLNQISIKKHVNPNHSDIQILLAVLLWSGWYRFLYLLLLFAFVIIIILRYRKFILSFLKKTTRLLLSTFSELKPEKKRIRLSITFIMGIILCFIFFNNTVLTGISLEVKESSTQTIAVNFAHGHGFPKSGFIENFENYKINKYHPTGDLTYAFLKEYKGAYLYHNPPIYELFMGSVYYIADVNPLLLKQIQLLLLIITVSFLPILGFKLAGNIGFWSGLISAPIVLQTYANLANQLEPDVLIIMFLFVLIYMFQKSILEEKYYKVIIIGVILSLILLTQLTLILLPFFVILYLLYILIKKPSRKATISFIILILSFTVPICGWSLYASNHLNHNLIKGSSNTEIHNTLINREFNNKDIAILEKLENYYEIKNTNNIISDGGWTGPLSVYEVFLVDKIIAPSLLHNKRIIIATKADPNLLFHTHNEYCINGKSSLEWTKHNDSYYNNDNKNYSPLIRVFLFYANHPKHFFIETLNKTYNGFSSFIFLFITIWIYIINAFSQYLNPLFKKKNPRYLKYFKVLISISLFALTFFVMKTNYFVFYSSLLALLLLKLLSIFNKKPNHIKAPEIFIIILISQILFINVTFATERFLIILNFIFVYQAISSLFSFNMRNRNRLTTSIHS